MNPLSTLIRSIHRFGDVALQRLPLSVGVSALVLAAPLARAVVPMSIDGAADVAHYSNIPWTLQKTGTFVPGSPAGTGTVNWTVTVTRGATTTNLVAAGYIDLANGTNAAVPIESFVVNLQKPVSGDYATVSSDIANSTSGDAATTATVDPSVTYEFIDTWTENAASGSLSLTDSSNNPVQLNSPVQMIGAGQTRRLYFVAHYNASALAIPAGTPLQLEVIVSFGNNFDIPSVAILSNAVLPAATVANGSVTLLDPSITTSGSVTTGAFAGLNQLLTAGGSFPLSVTANGGNAGGTVCNTAFLNSPATPILINVNGIDVPVATIPGINLSATDCQNIPRRPGEPRPLTSTINSCSQIVTYDASLFTSPSGPIVSAVFSPASGSTFPFGTSTVNFTVTDSEGNVATGVLTVNVLDTEAPVITPVSNITVPTDTGSCMATVTYSTTATDCNLASLTFSPASGSQFPIGTSVVTITATDTAGHVSTSTFSVTVNDVTAPVLATNNVQVNVAPGTCSANVSFGASSQDCSAVTYTYSLSPTFTPAIVSGASFPMGTTIVYVKATDASGNSTTGSFFVTVLDNEAPVITTSNIATTIAPGTCSAMVTLNASASDCSSTTLVYSLSPTFSPAIPATGVFPIGTTTVYVQATDAAGNVSTSSFTVVVTDNEAPVITTSNIITNIAPGTCAAMVPFAASATDCSAYTLVYSLDAGFSSTISSGASFPIGVTTVYVKATDASGNVSTASFTIKVVDNEAPVITVTPVQVNIAPGTCAANVLFAASATDCSSVSLMYALDAGFANPVASGASFPIGVTTIYVKATDAAGNSAVSSFTVTVIDNQAPVLTASNIQVTLTPGSCTANVTFAASATDCTAVTYTYSLSPTFSPAIPATGTFPIGTTTVYVMATDVAGNASATSFTVTVIDNLAPVISTTNIVTNVAPGTCAANVPFAASATDCSAYTLVYSLDAGFGSTVSSGASFPIGVTTVYVKATDASGNVSTASFTVKVVDNEAPAITVAPFVVNVAPGTCAANVAFGASATDCSAVTLVYALDAGFTIPVASGASFPIGTTTVYVKATDAVGNVSTSSFTVTVVDNQAPVISATNLQVNVTAGACTANVAFAATATDCSAVTFVYSLSSTFSPAIASGASFPIGTTTVYVKATDAAGNSSTSSFTVKVVDNQAPVLTTSNVQVSVAPGACSAPVTFAASATDCSAVTLVYSLSPTYSPTISSGASFPVGTTTVYVKATDASGNVSTGTFTVKVVDSQAPVLSATNITTNVIAGTCGANVNFAVTATDCSAVTIVYSLSATYSPAISSGANFPVGTTTVYVKATDSSGNVSTTTFTVKVVDSAAPVITAPNITVNNDLNECGANVNFNVTATDCSAVVLKYYLDSGCSTTLVSSGAQFPVGTTTVYVKATDASGNTSTKSFTVTVRDTQAPTITSSLSNITLVPDSCRCTATFCYTPTASDNCGGTIRVTVSPASGTVLAAGTTTTITVTATDSAGNVTTRTFTVHVNECPILQTTYTQGGWGAAPCGNNPGTLLARYFTTVYPSGLVVGGNGGPYTLKFTSASAIANALPLSGTPGTLTRNYINPTTLNNTFASQVVALRLNVDFSARDLFAVNTSSLGAMKLTSGELAGWTVNQVLSLANTVLGGKTSVLPAGVTISDLNSIVTSINGNFDNGNTNNGYLTY